jgi:AraC-like DNA-binding protein
LFTRVPSPPLSDFVRVLWAAPARGSSASRVERVLPTGDAHLVFRATDDPLRILSDDSAVAPFELGRSIVGGARSCSYAKDVTSSPWTVGAQLKPGAALALFSVAAHEFAEAHAPLDAFWGREAETARDRLFAVADPEAQLSILEDILLARLRGASSIAMANAPAMRAAVTHVERFRDVASAVARSGFSHRHFIARYREWCGLAPKLHARVLRFKNALAAFASVSTPRPIDVALDAGYTDQAHFARDFKEFAGVTPGEYRLALPRRPFHVALDRGVGAASPPEPRGQFHSRSGPWTTATLPRDIPRNGAKP